MLIVYFVLNDFTKMRKLKKMNVYNLKPIENLFFVNRTLKSLSKTIF